MARMTSSFGGTSDVKFRTLRRPARTARNASAASRTSRELLKGWLRLHSSRATGMRLRLGNGGVQLAGDVIDNQMDGEQVVHQVLHVGRRLERREIGEGEPLAHRGHAGSRELAVGDESAS